MDINLREALYETILQSTRSEKMSKILSDGICRGIEAKEKALTLAYEEAEENEIRQNHLKEWG